MRLLVLVLILHMIGLTRCRPVLWLTVHCMGMCKGMVGSCLRTCAVQQPHLMHMEARLSGVRR